MLIAVSLPVFETNGQFYYAPLDMKHRTRGCLRLPVLVDV